MAIKQNYKKVVALFDTHIPHNINLSGIMEFLRDFKPEYLILGGDIMNIDSLSHWSLAGGKRLTLEGKRLKKECEVTKIILDQLRDAVGESCNIVYLEGNHEDWVNQYIDKNPEMKGIIDLPLMLDLEKRNIKWIPYTSKNNYY